MNMLKRVFALLILGLLVTVNIVSAQDGGSTLQAWADTPSSAINLTPQMTWPVFTRTVGAINTYTATGDPALSCAAGEHSYSMWASFVAPQTSTITVIATGSNYDNVLGVFKTTATSEFRCANDFFGVGYESLTFKTVAGTRYYILFAANGTGLDVTGTSSLHIEIYTNIAENQPFPIPASGSYSFVQPEIENAVFAPDTNSTFGTCGSGDGTVYYSFKPAVSGRYEFSTSGSSYDTVMMLREGGVTIACNQNISATNANSRLRPNLIAGHTYVIGIGQTNGGLNPQTDEMVLSLSVRKM
jgi:hypothetical protein